MRFMFLWHIQMLVDYFFPGESVYTKHAHHRNINQQRNKETMKQTNGKNMKNTCLQIQVAQQSGQV